jgi:ATP-binding cassette subfamily C protein LapB
MSNPKLVAVVPSGQTERQPVDPLLACLIQAARFHGKPSSRDNLAGGLPVAPEGLSPELALRAARRVGMDAALLQCPVALLHELKLPAILLLHDREACLLRDIVEPQGPFLVTLPDDDESIEMDGDELQSLYTGHAISLQAASTEGADDAQKTGTPSARHWFRSILMRNRGLYTDVLFAALLINLFAMAMPMFTMNVYDRVVPNNAVETMWMLTLGIVIVLFADMVLRTTRTYFVDLAGRRIDRLVSSALMERVLALRVDSRPASVGAFASNLRAYESLRDFATSATVTALVDLPFVILFLAASAWINLWLVIPTLVGVIALVLMALASQSSIRSLSSQSHTASATRNATLVESLVALDTIKALNAEGRMQRRWEEATEQLGMINNKVRLMSASLINRSSWVSQMVSVGIVVLGVYLIGMREMTMGGLIACSMLSGRAMSPLTQAAGLVSQYFGAKAALDSLDKLMASPTERGEGRSLLSRSRLQGAIEFRNVNFGYPGSQGEVLKDVSFRIEAGERVAIIGKVGSGKSTIQKLLMGFYTPASGTILVDGIDMRQVDLRDQRRSIGYVGQDANLFQGNLRENLTMGDQRPDDEALLSALELGGMADFARQHPMGLDMKIGERGETLSGGQRKGISLARAALRNPAILLLDEPTDAMDHATEDEVKRRIETYAEGRTVLLVTHRNSLLTLADKLLVLDRGNVVAFGPREQVMAALSGGRIQKAA